MRRNIIIILCILLGIMLLMVSGNIIIVGEKIAKITHLWWMEYVFYGILTLLAFYYILYPIIRIHRAPPFPMLSVSDNDRVAQLEAFGKSLASHCDYISDENTSEDQKVSRNLREKHQKELKQALLHASGSETKLRQVIQGELDLRFNGDKELGVLGINARIKEWAKSVFMITALSQNSRFDTISVIYLNFKMIDDIICASGFRPSKQQLLRMYGNILATAIFTYAVSEALENTGSFAPFDFDDGVHSDVEHTGDVDLDDADFDAQVSDSDGLSVYSVLRRLKIPGVIVSSAIDGTVNALMTLRIGYVTRTYLQQGPKSLSGFRNKRAVKRQAMKDAIVTMPSVVMDGSSVIGLRTSNLILKLLKKDYSSSSSFKSWSEKMKSFLKFK